MGLCLFVRCLPPLLLISPVTALAQMITSAPANGTGAALAVPVNDPLPLGILLVSMLATGYWLLRRGYNPQRVLPLLLAATVGSLLWQSHSLRAQLLGTFTDPNGETLPIAVSPISSGTDIAGYQAADFSNASGIALRIAAIENPTFSQCFPGGVSNTLLPPGTPVTSPYPDCSAGLKLNDKTGCRVDVESLCRAQAAINQAQISAIPAALSFGVNSTGAIIVTNNGSSVSANTVVAVLPSSSNVSVQSSTCPGALPAGASCLITFSSAVIEGPTSVSIVGNNTNSVTGTITVTPPAVTLTLASPSAGSAAGGTGITLTGIGLTGTNAVTFDGIFATSVNVINDTTVTAVTPAHTAGAVDVVLTSPQGGAILSNGYTYLATAVGQSVGGGTIAALNGGLQNLIATTADTSTAIVWGGIGTATSAQSDSDGAANTTTAVVAIGTNGGTPYAAQMCSNYEVDSQGNTPCAAGNACYNDWFLPAREQLNALYTNRVAVGGLADAAYHSSTESSANPINYNWYQQFANGVTETAPKANAFRGRCVRSFTP